MILAPIILFVYKRFSHTKSTVESLLQNPLARHSELFVFCEAAKNKEEEVLVNSVRNYIQSVKGFKRVHIFYHKSHQGLARSVIQGVDEIFCEYDNAIVLEDDLSFSTDFLDFMNSALICYNDRPDVFSISGYLYPITIPRDYPHEVLLLPRASSWGWATWKEKWRKADWQVSNFETFMKDKTQKKAFRQGGEDLLPMLIKQQKGWIDSWAVRWSFTHFLNHAYGVFPVRSKVINTGVDGSGTHVGRTRKYNIGLQEADLQLNKNITPNKEMVKSLQKFFKLSLFRKLIHRIHLR